MEEQIVGQIVSFDVQRGFGFLAARIRAGEARFFVHLKDCLDGAPLPGTLVSFTPSESNKKGQLPKATRVEIVAVPDNTSDRT